MIWILRTILMLALLPCAARAQISLPGLGSAGGGGSTADGVLINADSMDRDLEKKTVVLDGNVQMVFHGQHMSCEHAVIDIATQQITAVGKVILSNERVHVEGDKVVFNYKENTGFIYNGFVQSGQVIFEGEVIQKMSETRYVATNAEYTACETCPPGWSFSGKVIDAEIGGYARIRRPIFKLGGFPILFLPGIIVPLKSDRQSGFLVPSMEVSGRGGLAFSEAYFWAISRSQDLTFQPKWYTLRGTKLHADYRYVLNETSRGRLQTAWLRDEVFKKEQKLDNPVDRYFAVYTHHHEMPDNFVHRVDIHQVSDLRYPRDFPNEMLGHGDPALENKTSLTKTTDDQLATAEVDIYTNLLKDNPLGSNDDSVHRAPELHYNIKERPVGDSRLLFSMNSQYVNFTRNRYQYDDVDTTANPDGTYTRRPRGLTSLGDMQRDGNMELYKNGLPGDLMRTGQRLDVRPTLAYPFQIAHKLDILPVVTYRETQYRFNPTESAEAEGFSPTAASRYVQTDLFVKTEFSRVYGSDDPKGERMKHAIEPEIGYSHIPWLRKPDHPFFGDFEGLQTSRQFDPISDADLNNPHTGMQFDYNDRTYEKQLVDFTLTNRLTRKIWINGEPDYRTAAIFRLSQAYDLNEAESQTPRPWGLLNMLADVRFDKFETYTTAQYNGYAKVTNISSRIRVMPTPYNFLQGTYTRNFVFDQDLNITPEGETRNLGLGAGLKAKYFDAIGQFDFEARDLALQSFGYAINLRPPGKCWVISFEHRKVVGADPQFHFAFSFNFGGNSRNAMFRETFDPNQNRNM